MKTHLYTRGRVACGDTPEHSPMIRDPALVDCERCRKTEVFRKIAAISKREHEHRTTEQMELFNG